MKPSLCELPKAFPRRTIRPRRRGFFRAVLRLLEAFCWVLGLVGIGWVAVTVARIHWFQKAQERELQNLERVSPPKRSNVLPTPRPGEPVGKIIIPRIGLSAVVAEGVDDSTLRTAVGHIPGTAVPEQLGNVALAGHRDTFFRDLRRVRANDLIVMETPRGRFQYRVERTSVVGPKATEVLQSDGQPELTLITCFPFHYVGPAPERFVVEATRVSPS